MLDKDDLDKIRKRVEATSHATGASLGSSFVSWRSAYRADVPSLLEEHARLRDLFGDHGLDPDRCGKYPGGEQCALRHGHQGRCKWANGD